MLCPPQARVEGGGRFLPKALFLDNNLQVQELKRVEEARTDYRMPEALLSLHKRRNLKGKNPGRVGGESRPQKSARRHFLFKPSGSDVAFEERRRGSIINPHFLLQTADATLTAFSAKPAAGKAVRTRPRTGLSGPKGLRALEQRARAYATHTFPARPNQAQQPQRQDQAGPEELQEPRESSGESLTQTGASTSP